MNEEHKARIALALLRHQLKRGGVAEVKRFRDEVFGYGDRIAPYQHRELIEFMNEVTIDNPPPQRHPVV